MLVDLFCTMLRRRVTTIFTVFHSYFDKPPLYPYFPLWPTGHLYEHKQSCYRVSRLGAPLGRHPELAHSHRRPQKLRGLHTANLFSPHHKHPRNEMYRIQQHDLLQRRPHKLLQEPVQRPLVHSTMTRLKDYEMFTRSKISSSQCRSSITHLSVGSRKFKHRVPIV